MSEIGVGFKLHGDASEFEKAISKAKEKTAELHHEVRGLNQTVRLFKEVAVGFGLVDAFSKTLEKAKQLREESEKNGTELNKSVAAAARLADTIDRVKNSAGTIGAKVVGGISSFFESVGDKARGGNGNLDQVHDDEERSKRANEMLEKGEATRKKIEAEREKAAVERAKGEERVNLLLAENAKLNAEDARYSKLSSEYEENAYQIEKNNAEIKKTLVDLDKQAVEQATKEAEQRKKIADESARHATEAKKKVDAAQSKVDGIEAGDAEDKADKGRLSLQQLANIGRFAPGVSSDVSNKSEDARQVFSLEKQANQARLSGDQGGYSDLMGQADKVRNSLSGTIHNSEAGGEGGMSKQLQAAVTELQEIKTQLSGKFVSQ